MLVGMDPVHASSSGVRTSISSTSNLYLRLMTSSYFARRLSAMHVLLNGFKTQGFTSPRQASGAAIRRAIIDTKNCLAMLDIPEWR